MKFLLLAARNPGDDALEHEQLAFGEILEIGGVGSGRTLALPGEIQAAQRADLLADLLEAARGPNDHGQMAGIWGNIDESEQICAESP